MVSRQVAAVDDSGDGGSGSRPRRLRLGADRARRERSRSSQQPPRRPRAPRDQGRRGPALTPMVSDEFGKPRISQRRIRHDERVRPRQKTAHVASASPRSSGTRSRAHRCWRDDRDRLVDVSALQRGQCPRGFLVVRSARETVDRVGRDQNQLGSVNRGDRFLDRVTTDSIPRRLGLVPRGRFVFRTSP